jgi:type I restriction enzyme, S subunit
MAGAEVALEDLMIERAHTVDPSRYPQEAFELFSVPAYDRGAPDVVYGRAIGSSKQLVQPGDVLLSKIVPHIRRAWVVRSQGHTRLLASSEWIVFRSPAVDPEFMCRMLVSDRFHAQLMATVAGVGGSLLRARPALVAAISVTLPTLDEQSRAARVLDAADALQKRRKRWLRQLAQLRQATFREMFGTGSPDDGGRWGTESIADTCLAIIDCVNRTAPTVDRETPFKMIRTSNVRHGKVDLTNVKYVDATTFARWNRRATPVNGDVLLTREAPMGEAGILTSSDQVILGQRLMLYRVDPTRLTSEYLLESFRSPFLQRQFARHGSGSTVKHLSLPACRSFEIVVPPIAQQRAFSGRVQAMDRLDDQGNQQISRMNALFASLQHQVFSAVI